MNYYNPQWECDKYENRPPTLAEYAMAKKEMEGEDMDKKDTLRKIEEMYSYAGKLEIELIESEARKILTADPDLDEFIMCMGSCFFTYKEGGKYDMLAYTDEELDELEKNDDPIIEFIWGNTCNIVQNEKFQEEFMDMVNDMDNKSNVKGYPMRFTRNGQVKHQW